MTRRAIPSRPLVRLAGATCGYGARPVLSDVDLTVEAGSFTAVVGPSGSGKTTLLRTIVGAVRPAAGTVERAARLALGYVPQVETVNWHFPVTVAEVLLMASRESRLLPWASGRERLEVDRLLDRLGLGGLSRRHVLELSGGQQQRVFIARALMRKPDLLLLDEPTSGVDVKTRHELLHLLEELNADGLTILLTTHDLNGIATHMPTVVCLNGRVIAAGAPFEVFTPLVLERTFGAPMETLEHAGMLMVVDSYRPLEHLVPAGHRH